MKNIDKRKLVGAIVGCGLFLICFLGLSLAYYQWKSGNTSVAIEISDGKGVIIPGEVIHATNIAPVLNPRKDGVIADFKVQSYSSEGFLFKVDFNITSISSNLVSDTFKWMLLRDKDNGEGDINTIDMIASGDFSSFSVGKNSIVARESVVGNNVYKYYFIAYIDGKVSNNTNMQSNSLVGELVFEEVL